MRDLKELNINRGGKPVQLPAPTEELFELFCSETGLTIPQGLRRLLMHSNGGGPELAAVDGEDGFAVNVFFYLSEEDGPESLWDELERWRPVLGDHALPFANTGGDDPFFLDLSTEPAKVKICLHEEEMEIVEIAPDFESFIDLLKIDPDLI